MLSCLRRLATNEISRLPRRYTLTRNSSVFAADNGLLPNSDLLTRTPPPSPSPTPIASSSKTPSYLNLPDHEIVLDLPPAEDPLLHYITSWLMRSGKRHAAQRRARRMLLFLHTMTRMEPLPLVRKAVELAAPSVRVITHRSGGKVTSIPVALNEKQRVRYAVEALLKASDKKPGKQVEERVAREIVGILGNSSEALTKKETVHKLAMVNRGNIREPRSR